MNTGTALKLAQLRGIWCEAVVAALVLDRGGRILLHRSSTPAAEIDLLVYARNRYHLLEVKSLTNAWFAPFRISTRQQERLWRAQQWLQVRYREPIQLSCALVTERGRVQVYPLARPRRWA